VARRWPGRLSCALRTGGLEKKIVGGVRDEGVRRTYY
jgi:hypothetical protein